jgi:hypothetical protein
MPGVELVAHPQALRLVANSRAELFDQIVEIEQRAGALARAHNAR